LTNIVERLYECNFDEDSFDISDIDSVDDIWELIDEIRKLKTELDLIKDI